MNQETREALAHIREQMLTRAGMLIVKREDAQSHLNEIQSELDELERRRMAIESDLNA